MTIAFGDVCLICSETCLTMPALVLRRSSRGSRACRDAGRDDDDVGIDGLLVAVRADDARIESFDRGRLPLVEPFPLRDSLDDVDDNDRPRQLLLGDALRGRRANIARADDRNFVDHECFAVG